MIYIASKYAEKGYNYETMMYGDFRIVFGFDN